MNLDFFIKTVEDKAQVQATQGLWEYQARAHDNVYAAYRAGHRSVMVVLFAGGGKTRVASSIAANWPHGLKGVSQRVMFLAHRNELLHQGRGALSQATGRMVDTEKAAERSSQHSRVIVASVQTMQREARLKRFKPDEFGLIIIDEAHRAAGTISYKTIMDYFPAAKLLLLTATPMRADKKSMGLITNHVAVHHDMAWGVKEGYILEPEVHSIFIQSIDISQVTITAGELNKAEQDAVFSVEKTQLSIARATLDNIGDRTTILFSGPSVATAEKLTEILNRPAFKPGCARLVHADTPEDERREIKAKHEAGEFQILVNVGIYTEGYDSPKVSAIVLARMTKSRTLLEQMACRGDRLLPGIGSLPTREQRLAAIAASAKPKFLLIDFHGNMGRHNLATMVDVFAGEYTEAIKARAKELLKEEALTPTQALEKAQEEHDKKEAKKAQRAALRRSQMSATVRWTSKVFNPFALLGIPEMGVLPKGEVKLASLRDARLLEEAGFKPPVEGWTHEVASVVVEEIKRRKSLGLCSARMVATLKRMGVDATSMPMEKAGYLIGALKRNRGQHKFWGWLPGQKDRIMRGARE